MKASGITAPRLSATSRSAIVSIGTGASVGREGPAVHIGASLASRLGQRLKLSRSLALTLLSCGVAAAVALHLIYVKPMKASENSTGFSVREYAGKTGELTTGVPEGGFGEVIVRMGASTTFQTAASFSGAPIPSGTAVVVVEVDREGVLRVAPLDREDLTVATDATPHARLQTR